MVEENNNMAEMLVLFDADETLWTSEGRDWVGSVSSTFSPEADNQTIRRDSDRKAFNLRRGTREALAYLAERNIAIGLVSDNTPEAVEGALNAFGIADSFEPSAVSVRRWKGYCPKDVMIGEILALPQYAGIRRDNVYFLDDKDYALAAEGIGVQFRRVDTQMDMLQTIKELIP